jgi:hypothetical protein
MPVRGVVLCCPALDLVAEEEALDDCLYDVSQRLILDLQVTLGDGVASEDRDLTFISDLG